MFQRGDKVSHILGYKGVIMKELPPEIGQQICPQSWREGDRWFEMLVRDEISDRGQTLRSPSYELFPI